MLDLCFLNVSVIFGMTFLLTELTSALSKVIEILNVLNSLISILPLYFCTFSCA